MRSAKKRRRITKKEAQRRHFERRMVQRYGLVSNKVAANQIRHYIQSGAAECVRRDTNRVTIFSVPAFISIELKHLNDGVDLGSINLVVAYDNIRHQLVTCGEVIG